MTRVSVPIVVSALALLALLPLRAPAQAANDTVYAAGMSEIRRVPEFLRVQVDVLAMGKDIKEALAKLKERQDKVRAQLTKLDASKNAVQFSEAGLSSLKTEHQAQYEAMIQMRLKGGAKKPVKGPPQVVVGANLKADLPLKGAADDVLAAIQSLQDKVRAADLSGIKELEKSVPQDPELLEEMAGYVGPRRGEPSFQFVARISDAERDRGLAEAFQKARKDAERFARAAGADVGAVHQMSGEYSEPEEGAVQDMSRVRDRNAGVPVEWTGEAVGIVPGPVSIRFLVKVHFHLKAGK